MSSAGLRHRIGQTLATINEDWPVAYTADAVADPGFLIVWGPDLWRTVATYATDTVAAEVILFAGRADAEAALEQLEQIVDAALPVLAAADLRHQGVTVPAPMEIGGITYLTARIRIQIAQPIQTT